ncbi:thermonuclease family protein [Paenarthrobacter sp. YJN-5]|uniref:thermonuclease family protein n=1 Tax=Paenarthrobacter sp. YJN-5 TaxID=2735316 RepID=UPI001878A9CF|nr:thermonuclease family protein [Paenarthrobacter sp. YJN-5]QOT16699.1 thermonuclease family protein [Paenarthrobacter sp. YJN-5]
MKCTMIRPLFGGLIAAVLCIVTLTGCEDLPMAPGIPGTPSTSTAAAQEPAQVSSGQPAAVGTKVIRVIDGDTVAVQPVDGVLKVTDTRGDVPEHTVRLLGIDAPEMNYRKDTGPECGAKAATDHLGGILPEGLPVTVQFDPKSDRTDRYGRSLAYVITPADNDAARQQVTDGYAMPWFPKGEPEPQRTPEYRTAAEKATALHAGAHSQCPSIGRG